LVGKLTGNAKAERKRGGNSNQEAHLDNLAVVPILSASPLPSTDRV